MDRNIYVTVKTTMGCELSCVGFDDISQAREYIRNDLVDMLDFGDIVLISDVNVE